MGFFVIMFICIMIKLCTHEDINKKIARMDADPNCTVKSNDWYKAHPEAKGK